MCALWWQLALLHSQTGSCPPNPHQPASSPPPAAAAVEASRALERRFAELAEERGVLAAALAEAQERCLKLETELTHLTGQQNLNQRIQYHKKVGGSWVVWETRQRAARLGDPIGRSGPPATGQGCTAGGRVLYLVSVPLMMSNQT